jgi:histidinol-phosphate phosphatase family protein
VSARYETVFLDRDGVLNVKAAEGDYVRTAADLQWLPGTFEALRLLQAAGARLVVVTHQRGVARGLMSRADLDEIHARLRSELAATGVALAGIYACTHHVGACDCRKPGIGLFEQARRDEPAIDPATSAMVGDSLSDLEAAGRFGCDAYLVAHEGSTVAAAAADRGVPVRGTGASLLEVAERHLLAPRAVGARA